MRLLQTAKPSKQAIFVRADLDVALDPLDKFRLETLLPTLNYLLERNCRVVLAGHVDRPHGKFVRELRTAPIANWLRNQGFQVEYNGKILPPQQPSCEDFTGKITLLENLRFDAREEKNNREFAKELARYANLYVNEAFANSHRQHTSMVGITRFLPSFAGLHLQKEIQVLSSVLKNPGQPLLFIIGGAKSKTKLPLVKAFAKTADTILLGRTLMFEKPLEGVPKVRFPVDAVQIFDIGPRTIKMFKTYIQAAKTIVWNGPLGKFEDDRFAQGTDAMAQAVLASQASQIVIGGGDTIDALKKLNLFQKAQKDPRVFLSSGGGAMLAFLARQEMPALHPLAFNFPA